MIVRDLIPHDLPAVRQLLTLAFGDDGQVAGLADALMARPDRPGVALVAEKAGAPVGHVQLSRGWVDAPRQLVEVLILSPLGVVPHEQRRGVGKALLDAAVQRAARLGTPAVFLEGNPDYYGPLGWQQASGRGFGRPSVRIPDIAFQVVVLPAWEGWMTGPVVYNDTFWAKDFVGLREPA